MLSMTWMLAYLQLRNQVRLTLPEEVVPVLDPDVSWLLVHDLWTV
jgi:hypothetical protein